MFLGVLTKAIQNSVETMKTFFLGDFNYQDLQDVMRREVPQSFLEARFLYSQGLVSQQEFNTGNIIVRQYGLIGWLFNLNMAVIRATDTDTSKTLLHTIDNMPNARRPFSLLEKVPQVTQYGWGAWITTTQRFCTDHAKPCVYDRKIDFIDQNDDRNMDHRTRLYPYFM